MIKVFTETGSVYLIDKEKKRWKRIKRPLTSNPHMPLRTPDGSYNKLYNIEIGKPMRILADSLTPLADGFRLIETSHVTKIQEFNQIPPDSVPNHC